MRRKLIELIYTYVDVTWLHIIVEEMGDPMENHRHWAGNHYPARCLGLNFNLDGTSDGVLTTKTLSRPRGYETFFHAQLS